MRLLAISDLHVGYAANLAALDTIGPHPDDWLILGGDLGETEAHLEAVLDSLVPRFAQALWVPGNHELWATDGLRGEAKYARCVDLCRARGVLTPEDPYPVWPGPGPERTIAPLFLLYDYSFAPDGMSPGEAVAWAGEHGIRCTDERFLDPAPHASVADWCRERLRFTSARLGEIPAHHRTVLINHFPFRRDLVRLPRIPRFIPWCGTRVTEDWHLRWRADVVVNGHLHMRATDWRDGTRFEEVAVGYPRHWNPQKTWGAYLREILPGPPAAAADHGPIWHR